MFELLTGLVQNLGYAFWAMVNGLVRAGMISSYFIRDIFRAHFNTIARHTAPLEQDLLGTEPPNPREFNVFGQMALFPLVILSWIIALTIAPLIYNSWLLFVVAFIRAANLALLDQPVERHFPVPKGQMPWYRQLFGLPGVIIGGFLGLTAAGVIAFIRVIRNSAKSFIPSFVAIVNLSLDKEDEISDFISLEKDLRLPELGLIYGFGLPGVILGGFAGVLGFAAVGFGRILTNSFKTAKRLTVSAMNVVRYEGEEDVEDLDADSRPARFKFGLGFPGLIFGSISAALGISFASLRRSAIESWETGREIFEIITKKAWPEGHTVLVVTEDDFPGEGSRLTNEELESTPLTRIRQRTFLNQYIFGAPGVLLGLVSGSIGFAGILTARMISASFESAKHSFASVINLALDPNDEFEHLGLEKDTRLTKQKHGFGLAGTILGGLVGLIGIPVVGIGRMMTNSWETMRGLTRSAHNLVSYDNEQVKGVLKEDTRLSFRKYFLGFPGLIIGSVTGAFAFAFAAIGRAVIESGKTAKEVFTAIANEARLATEDDSETSEWIDLAVPRTLIDQWFFGATGFLLGGLAGSLRYAGIITAHIFEHSVESAKQSFASVTNLGLHPSHQIQDLDLLNDARLPKRKYGFGLPGVILGGFAGIFGFLAMGFGRNSFETAKRLTASALNAVRDEQINEHWKNDKRRSVLQYVLGFPGLIIGSITSAVAVAIVGLERANIQSWKTTKEFFNTIVNQALPDDSVMEVVSPDNTEERSFTDRYILGGPGVLLGGLSGSIGFTAIIVGRSIVNSFKSAVHSFASVTNLALHEDHQFKDFGLDKDPRLANPRLIYGFGLPGVILGGFAGVFGFAAVGFGRILTHSFETAKRLTVSAMNVVRYEGEENAENLDTDSRSAHFKFGLGFPGLIFGSMSAALGISFASLRRSVIESWETTKDVYEVIARQARPEVFEALDESDFRDEGNLELDSPIDFEMDKSFVVPTVPNEVANPKKRTLINQYLFGAPGVLLGIVSGSLGFVGILTGRMISASYESAKHSFASAVNLVLDPNDEFKHLGLQKDARLTKQKYGFGLVGTILGGLAGLIAIPVVGVGRTITNSLATIKSLTLSGYNLLRYDNGQIGGALKDDTRQPFRKFGLGFPGLIIGSITAAFAVGIGGMERVVIESAITTIQVFTKIVTQAFAASEGDRFNSLMPHFERTSSIDSYGFGAPGVLLGAIIGSIGFVIVGLARGITNSIDTGSRMFTTVANLGLDEDEQFPYQQLEHQDERSWQIKYLLGLPGAMVGAIFGGITLAGIGAVKLANHSFHSWRSLSGSFLNGSLELPLFRGLAGDKDRSDHAKIAGGLGYVLAAVTTLPIAVVIFTFKRAIPVVFALLIGVISSPIVAGLKWYNQAFKNPRFSEAECSGNATEQQFKNMYSSLTSWGQLPENQAIKDDQNGRKGPACFARKAVTFNISSITEYTLDRLLTAYRESENKESFFNEDGEFPAILAAIKDHYKTLSCLEPEHHISDRDEQIDKLGSFVKDYVLGKNNSVPEHLYSNPQRSWSAIFWGAEQTVISQNEELLGVEIEQQFVG